MPPASPPPESPLPTDGLPHFAMPYPHRVYRAEAAMPCGCARRTIRAGEAYVTIGSYGRVNCWGCLVYYGWATLADVPEAIRAEVAAAQNRAQPSNR